MTPAEYLYHIRCGKHSGFPTCCIGWWLGFYKNLPRKLKRRWLQLQDKQGISGYVRCPACVARGRIVKTYGCECFAVGDAFFNAWFNNKCSELKKDIIEWYWAKGAR